MAPSTLMFGWLAIALVLATIGTYLIVTGGSLGLVLLLFVALMVTVIGLYVYRNRPIA